jgi:hypothetical protein
MSEQLSMDYYSTKMVSSFLLLLQTWSKPKQKHIFPFSKSPKKKSLDVFIVQQHADAVELA